MVKQAICTATYSTLLLLLRHKAAMRCFAMASRNPFYPFSRLVRAVTFLSWNEAKLSRKFMLRVEYICE